MADAYISGLDAAGAITGAELLEVSQLSTTVVMTATTLSAQASDNSYNDSANGFITEGFAVGDRVHVAGFTGNVANNITAGRITLLTAGKMTIGGTDGDVIVDDAAGESVTITKWETRRVTAADLAAAGAVAFATTGEINTGTNTTKAVNPDGLAGSRFGTVVISILVSDPGGSAITTGDGKAYYRVPAILNGMNLVSVAAALTTASSSGIPTVQIANVTDGVDMLSTKLTVDASETDSSTATAPAVIDATKDDVATADLLRIDIDVAGTGAKGLIVELGFQLP